MKNLNREQQAEQYYRDTIFKNKDIYPNLYQLEIRRNRWKFKKEFKRR